MFISNKRASLKNVELKNLVKLFTILSFFKTTIAVILFWLVFVIYMKNNPKYSKQKSNHTPTTISLR